MTGASEGEPEQDGNGRCDENGVADHVYLGQSLKGCPGTPPWGPQENKEHDSGEAGDGHIEPENPAPGGGGDNLTADERSQCGAQVNCEEYEAHEQGSLLQRDHVGDDDVDEHGHTASARTHDGTTANQHGRRGGTAADACSEQEYGNGEEHDGPPTEEICHLRIEGDGGRAMEDPL